MSRAPRFPPGSFWGFAERYADAARPDFVYDHRPVGSFGIALLDVTQGAVEFVDIARGRSVFATALGASAEGEVDMGEGWRRDVARRGVVDLQPSDVAIGYRLPPLRLRSLAVDAAAVAARLDEVGLSPSALDAVSGRFRPVPQAGALLEMAWRAARGGGPAASLVVDGAFLAMLGTLLRAGGEARLDAPAPPVGDRRIAEAIEHIEAHLDRPVRTDELARVAGLSVFHFGRVFHAATGRTPHAFLTWRRIERARRLLVDPDLPLAQVAAATGFASQSHFTRVFRAHVGATPGAFRAEMAG